MSHGMLPRSSETLSSEDYYPKPRSPTISTQRADCIDENSPDVTSSLSSTLRGQKRSYRERECALGMNAPTILLRAQRRTYRERKCALGMFASRVSGCPLYPTCNRTSPQAI